MAARTAEEVRRDLSAVAVKPVTVTTPPSPTRGRPRVPYERIYILLPPDADKPWAKAVVEATWDTQRLTLGNSADDAGIGDLDVRRVIAVNPYAWGPGDDGTDLEGFFRRHYPGVAFQPVLAATPEELRLRLGGQAEQFTPLGIHDVPDGNGPGPGCRWMMNNGVPGWAYVVVFIRDQPLPLNYSAAAAAGLKVVVNLRYSWSTDLGGQGTLPPAGEAETRFVAACRQTVQQSQGIWGWTVGNEPNNPREWPGGGLTPERVAAVYNQIRAGLGARFAPAPVDPFFGPGSDNRNWFRRIWANVTGAEFVDLHGYVRGPNHLLCWSEFKFQNAPLTWQYLNFSGCCRTLMAELPGSYRVRPVLISEFNHLWKFDNGPAGWVDDKGPMVVRAAVEAVRGWNNQGGQQVAGLVLYRWAGDEWALKDMNRIKAELARLNRDGPFPRFVYPIRGRPLQINGHFGIQRDYGLHEGIDLFALTGELIVPVMDGVVDRVRDIGSLGYGRYVRVDHQNGYVSWYGHLDQFAPDIQVGSQVVAGQTVLGLAGSTGNSTGPHLHLTVQRPGIGLSGFVEPDVVDPLPFLV